MEIKQSKIEEFNNIHPKPNDLKDINNKICTCDICASNYLYRQDVETYDKLFRYKYRIMRHYDIKEVTSDTSLDNKITQILSNIKESDIEQDSFKLLRMKPLNVVNKIYPENRLLISSINNDNEIYFNYIKEKLSQLSAYMLSFRKVAAQVKTCFLSLLEKSNDQDEIYNSIVQWILDSQLLDESFRAAAHIIVSFFVQDCEVFDEITE